MSKNSHYTAKDRAFDEERARARRERNELRKQIEREHRKQDDLRQEISELKSQLDAKDDWIERLLQFTELTPAQVQNLLEDQKRSTAAKESLNSVFGASGLFGGLMKSMAPTIASTLSMFDVTDDDNAKTVSMPLGDDTPLTLHAEACRDNDDKPAILLCVKNSTNGNVTQDVVQVTPDDKHIRVLLWKDACDEFYTDDIRIDTYHDADEYRKEDDAHVAT